MTRLPGDPNNAHSQRDTSETPFQYSSREVTPPQLLIQQLRRAHSTFLLHHAASLDTLYTNAGRTAFCLYLENYWLRFAWNWEVLLGGNPAVEIYNGVKLSAGGELGVGVGEEEWGSGEREVLEDFVSRTDGLVDLVVSRFGDPNETEFLPESTTEDEEKRWLGSDAHPRPSDGVIFSGVGAITRNSLVSVSQWMEWIYRYGVDTYGVGEDPSSPRRRKRRKRQRGNVSGKTTASQPASNGPQGIPPEHSLSPGIPPPLVGGPPPEPSKNSQEARKQTSDDRSPAPSDKASDWMTTGTETFVKYLTLGYGSSWSLSGTSTRANTPQPQAEASNAETRSAEAENPKSLEVPSNPITRPRDRNNGRFIIGLQDSNAHAEVVLEEVESSGSASDAKEKIPKRMIHVRMTNSQQNTAGEFTVRFVHKSHIFQIWYNFKS